MSSGITPWPTNLTDCCASPGGLPRCCLALWCPCLSYAELVREPELKSYCCAGDRVSACVSYALLQLLGFFPAAALHAGARSTLRNDRRYSGSLAEDFCATACCSTCALVQELNAADNRQAAAAATVLGPPAPVQMVSVMHMSQRGAGGQRASGRSGAPRGATRMTSGVALCAPTAPLPNTAGLQLL